MKPSLGRVVIYVRAANERFAARISRGTSKIAAVGQDLAGVPEESLANVYLAVDVHEAADPPGVHCVGRTWYSPAPVRFDDSEAPAANTWHWPPRV